MILNADKMKSRIADMLLGQYHEVIEDDDLGAMMSFMDEVGCQYSGYLGLGESVEYENDQIRDCFFHAYERYIRSVISDVQILVRNGLVQ